MGCGGGAATVVFFPAARTQAQVLEKREGEHREQRMVMQAQPTAPFEMIESEFFLHLLVGLLTHPPRFDRRRQRTERCSGWMIREVILPFAVATPFADQPGEVARQMLTLRRLRTIGDAYAHGRELRVQRPACPGPPTHRPPAGCGEHHVRAAADVRRDAVPARSPSDESRNPQPHLCWEDFLCANDSHGPRQLPCGERLPKRGTAAVTRVRQHHAKRDTGCTDTVELVQRNRAFGAIGARGRWHVRPLKSSGSLRSLFREEQTQSNRHWHLTSREGEGDHGLTIRALSRLSGILARHAHRVRPLFEERRVVDDQDGVRPAHQALGLVRQRGLEGGRISRRGGDEVVQLLVIGGRHACGHGLDALAVPGSEQTL